MRPQQAQKIRDRYLKLLAKNETALEPAELKKLELSLESFDYDVASQLLAKAERLRLAPAPSELLADLAKGRITVVSADADENCSPLEAGQSPSEEQILVAEIVAKDQIEAKVAWKYASVYAAPGTARQEVEEAAQAQAERLSAIYGKEMIVRYYHMDDLAVSPTVKYGPIRGFPDLEKQPDPIHEIIHRHKPPLEVWKAGGKGFDWDSWEAQIEEDIRQWILGYLAERVPDLAIPENVLAESIHLAHKQEDHPARWLVARLLAYRASPPDQGGLSNRQEGLWQGFQSTI